MFLQTDSVLNPIKVSGCYFCSLGKLSELITGYKLTAEQVMKVYAEAMCSNLMDWKCYLRKPDSVLGLFIYELTGEVALVKYIGWWNADMNTREPEMWDRWREADITHEVIRRLYKDHPDPKKREHHFGLNNWNPWPQLKCGPMNGRRLFHVELMGEAA